MPKPISDIKNPQELEINELKNELFSNFEEKYQNRINLADYKVNTKTNLLAKAYKNRISKEFELCNIILEDASKKSKSALHAYKLEIQQILSGLSKKIDTFLIRLKEFDQIEARITSIKKIPIEMNPDFLNHLTNNRKENQSRFIKCPILELVAYKITQGFSSEALDAYILLSTEFDPDELDSPLDVCQGLKKKFQKHLTNPNITEKKVTIWDHSILIVVHDRDNNIQAVADGTLIVQDKKTVFYAAHLVVVYQLRSKGVGAWLNDILLQAAESSLQEAKQEGLMDLPLPKNSKYYLMGEISEIEFPDKLFYNKNSFLRLPFHGRMGRKTLWPLLYAQPDTNYQESSFNLDKWYSLPMFLCFRTFNEHQLTKKLALSFTWMLFDYFSLFYKKGSEWDRKFLKDGIKKYPNIQFVSFPTTSNEIENFIHKTGLASDILPKLYPDHNYTRERKEIIFLLTKSDT